ncbi:MAG: SDR family oxidoreductase [Chloroflexi bacterium]|nr:SDR family oxidoreductase [Chloroflexota bacterium]
MAEIKKQGGAAVPNYDTVATAEGGKNIIKAATDNFGKIDILLNIAGIVRRQLIFDMTPEDWDAVIKVNLYGIFNCTRPAATLMWQQRSGRIINTASPAGLGTWNGAIYTSYAAAKEGVAGFTRALAIALGGRGVTCNAIRPGASTRFTVQPKEEEELRRMMLAAGVEAPPRPSDLRHGAQHPEDVVPLVVWLCTDAAANVNGCDFRVAGGHIGLYSKPAEVKCIDKDGRWTLDELDKLVPEKLTAGLTNPAKPGPTTAKK